MQGNEAEQQGLAFQARVMRFLCICGLATGIPFGVWHSMQGNLAVLMMLSPAMVAQAIALYLLSQEGFTRVAAHIVAIVQMAAAVSYVYLVGTPASYWLFASCVANFYLIRWPSALSLNFVASLAVAFLLRDNPDYLVRFIINFVLVNLFLLFYTRQLELRTDEVFRLLNRDSLTGAGSRLALDGALAHVRELHERYGTPVTVLMLDLDHFKNVNDRYGHAVGDRVLCEFSELVMQRLRSTDTLYRFGGEEFVVLAENTREEDAEVLAEDIRQCIENQVFEPTDGITLSIGLAELRTDEDLDAWLRRADKALYAAKHSGRNSVRSSA